MTREDLIDLIRQLPAERIPVAEALLRSLDPSSPPFKPVPLGGLLEGYVFTEASIAEARRQMLGRFGERLGS
jgi:hypothetical protein